MFESDQPLNTNLTTMTLAYAEFSSSLSVEQTQIIVYSLTVPSK